MKKISILLLCTLIILFITAYKNIQKDHPMTEKFKAFTAKFDQAYRPLSIESNTAYWNASISGKDEDYNKVELLSNKMSGFFSSKEDYTTLKKIKESKSLTDPILKRELNVLYNAYLSHQFDTNKLNAINKLQVEIEQKYSNYRAEVNGKKLTDNDVEDVLHTSTNSEELKAAWMAHKKIGPVVAADIIRLVKMRNEQAKSLGFKNFHEMSLQLSEQNPKDIEKIFNELDSLTRKTFKKLKGEIDTYFAKRYVIKTEELMPWHYQNRYFQEAPKIYQLDVDTYYKKADLVELTKKYYDGIGLNIDGLVAKSDLFEKPGKNQHAYCIDIDNEGDVRVLCNVKPNANWMGTMLHEFGHAVYDKYISTKLPFVLREPAHTFTTEAIAMMFGRFSSNAQWMKDNLGINQEEAKKIAEDGFKILRLEQMVFSRWAQVMYRFEKALYANPDQDLNKLWWDLVEKYQMMKRPAGRNEPDWASKIHIATSPCYYHNYLLGELLASQLYHYIVKNVIKSQDFKNQSFSNNAAVGKYLKEKVFEPGSRYYWNEMIEKATGEKLTAKYYASQFVN